MADVTEFVLRGQPAAVRSHRRTRLVVSPPWAEVHVDTDLPYGPDDRFTLRGTDAAGAEAYAHSVAARDLPPDADGLARLRFPEAPDGGAPEAPLDGLSYTLVWDRADDEPEVLFEGAPYGRVFNAAPAGQAAAPARPAQTLKLVRFLECPAVLHRDLGPDSPLYRDEAEPLRTRTVPRAGDDGRMVEARDERWVVVFRTEEAEGDPGSGPADRAVYVQEFFADEDGLYHRVPTEDGDRREPAAEALERAPLVGRGPTDDEPTYHVWVSPEKLPVARIERLRTDLARDGRVRHMEPLGIRGTDLGRSVRAEGGGWDVYVAEPWRLAEERAVEYQAALYDYLLWTGRVAPVLHMAELVRGLINADGKVERRLRTVRGVNARLAWKADYARVHGRLWQAASNAATLLLAELQSTGFQAAQVDYAVGDLDHREAGLARYAGLVRDLDVPERGQAYLDGLYSASRLHDSFAAYEATLGDRAPTPSQQRERLQALAREVEALFPDPEGYDPQEPDGFNAFNEVYGLADKARGASHEMLGVLATTAPRVHRVASNEALAVVATVYETRVASLESVAIHLTPWGAPAFETATFRIEPRAYVVGATAHLASTQVYEVVDAPTNAVAEITQSAGYVRFSGGVALVNLALAGVALRDFRDKPLETSAGMGAAALNVISFGLERKVAAATGELLIDRRLVEWEWRLGQRATGAGAATQTRIPAASAGMRLTVLRLARVSMVLDLVVGAWSMGQEYRQGDDGWTIAGVGMMTAGSMALGASAAGFAGTGTVALGATAVPVAGIVIAAGILLFAGGYYLFSSNDDSDVSLWAERHNLWGERYLTTPTRQSVVAVADRLVGDDALAVAPSPAFNRELGRQLEELYKVFFAFDLSVDWDERVHGSRFDFDPSDDVDLHLVTVRRKMPGMPLPHGAALTVTVEGLGDRTTIHPVEVDFATEALARLPLDEATAVASLSNGSVPIQRLLTAPTPADEGDGDDVRTAETLVLRLYDPSRAVRLMAVEGRRPVGVTAVDLDTAVSARAAYSTVTATITVPLGGGLDPLVITETHRGW